MVATDAPTTDFAQDRLRFGPLARGISRFLRNASTKPPLTLAISGDWGSGKSSLMSLVCSDLRRHGSRPVWFNAWHHQKDEQLLAALLNAVRDQCVPSSVTPDGWVFRLRLLWLRSKKHFLLVFAISVTVSAVIAFLMVHSSEEWGRLGDIGKLFAQLASGITVLVAIRKALTAFGADPAVLLSASAEQFRLKDASALTIFRSRFASQFDEVTQCLPGRMVIVIDDLDRCRPEAVLEVMEAVNFLVSSGTCFVMFGMATSRVQAALALSFDKIAAEMIELSTGGETLTPEQKDRMEHERRRSYARDYMEKLVNLEIVVPAVDGTESHLLLEPLADETGTIRLAFRPFVSRWPLVLYAVAILVGWHLGASIKFLDSPPPPVLQMGALVSTTFDGTASHTNPASLPTSIVPSLYPVPTVQPGDERGIAWYVFAVPIALLTAWGVGFVSFRLRTNLYHVKDSRAFLEALRIWTPLVQQHRKTPRALKRFGNRIRYLAMLQQAERLDESRSDVLSRMVSSWWRKFTGQISRRNEVGDAAPLTLSVGNIREDMIVALGALNEVFGSGWRMYMEDPLPSGLQDAVCKAVENHRMGLHTHWPATAAELESFENSLLGIRVPSA